MKTSYLLAFGMAIGVYSQINFAGVIFDTYATGDTLTATKLENIKTAVIDNDTRLRIIETAFSGDGSAGDLFITTDVNWVTNPPANPYFSNIVISNGVTLTVPAGTTIYCAGSFNNLGGILRVEPGAIMGSASADTVSLPKVAIQGRRANAHPGDTAGSASIGGSDITALTDLVFLSKRILHGGTGGLNIPRTVAMTSFGNFKYGGGSGASFRDGRGGGLVKIYAGVQIINQGLIDAQGEDAALDAGTGGGGGGIVILAARGAVINSSGTIDVSGGNGANGDAAHGNGGGGGGGIIIMASPITPALGTENVSPATTGGTSITLLTTFSRNAGGGGGGSGGFGASGGSVDEFGAPATAFGGSLGYVISLTLDPIALAR